MTVEISSQQLEQIESDLWIMWRVLKSAAEIHIFSWCFFSLQLWYFSNGASIKNQVRDPNLKCDGFTWDKSFEPRHIFCLVCVSEFYSRHGPQQLIQQLIQLRNGSHLMKNGTIAGVVDWSTGKWNLVTQTPGLTTWNCMELTPIFGALTGMNSFFSRDSTLLRDSKM